MYPRQRKRGHLIWKWVLDWSRRAAQFATMRKALLNWSTAAWPGREKPIWTSFSSAIMPRMTRREPTLSPILPARQICFRCNDRAGLGANRITLRGSNDAREAPPTPPKTLRDAPVNYRWFGRHRENRETSETVHEQPFGEPAGTSALPPIADTDGDSSKLLEGAASTDISGICSFIVGTEADTNFQKLYSEVLKTLNTCKQLIDGYMPVDEF